MKAMGKAGIAAALLFVGALLGAQSITLSLEQAIALGLENSGSVKSQSLAVAKAQIDLQIARCGYTPSLTAGAGWSHLFKKIEPVIPGVYTTASDPVSLSLNLGQSIYSFGKVENGIRLAEESLRAAELGLGEEKRSLSTQIRRAFYGYLLAEEVIRINEETLAGKISALEVARKKFAAGIASDFEVLQAEADVESFRPNLISAQNQVKIALLTVKNLLGFKDEDNAEIRLVGSLEYQEPSLPGMEKLVETALSGKYDLQSLRINRRMAELQDAVTRSSRLPTISGLLSYSLRSGLDSSSGANKYWGADSWDGSLSGGLNVQVPISSFFPWSKESLEMKKSPLTLADLDLGYDSLASGIKTNVRSILLKLEEAKLKIASGQKSLALSQRLLQSANEQYARGLISNMTLKDAQLGLNGARLAYIQTIYQYQLNLTDLMDAIGVERF